MLKQNDPHLTITRTKELIMALHRKALEFFSKLWFAEVPCEACLECGYDTYKSVADHLYVKEGGMAPTEVLGVIASAMLDVGIELSEVRSILRAKSERAYRMECGQWGKPESEREPLPEVTEQELRAGEWRPTECVLISRIREVVQGHFPDEESDA